MISMEYSKEYLRKISKNWEVLTRRRLTYDWTFFYSKLFILRKINIENKLNLNLDRPIMT